MPIRVQLVAFTFVAALVAAIHVPAQPAAAQGTFGALPDPISSRDLNDFAERLGLSDQQLVILSDPHARYLEQFRGLREREIEAFMDRFRGFRGMRRFDPTLFGQMEPLVRDFNRLTSRIRTLDEQFFSDMQAVLTPAQAEMMPRIRHERERDRYTSEATRWVDFINPAVRVDLSAMIRQLDLPPGEAAAIDPILMQYENRLTSTTRRVFDASVKTVLDGLKALEDLGIDENITNHPGEMMRVFNAAQEIWSEVTEDLLKEAAQLTQLNRSTFRQLSQIMPEDSARLLREQFYSRAYPEAASIGRTAEAHFLAALEMDLPDDLAQSIHALASGHMQSQDRLANQVADQLDQLRRNITLMQTVRRGDDPTRNQIEEIRSRAQAADEGVIETLKAMLGPELASQLRPASVTATRQRRLAERRGRFGPGGLRMRGGGPRGGEGRRPDGGMHQAALAFLDGVQPPDRITAADVSDLAQRLNTARSSVTLLESLHDDYVEGFQALRRQYAAPYARLVEELRDASGSPAEIAQKIEEALDLLESLIEGARDLDERFLSDVRIAVIDSGNDQQMAMLASMQSSRERVRYRVPISEGRAFGFGGSNEGAVDLVRLIEEIDLDDEVWPEAVPVLAEYEQEAGALFRDRFTSEMAIHRATVQFSADRFAEGDRGRARQRFRNMGEQVGEIRRLARTANESLADLNRETLSALLDALPESAGAQLMDLYNREAFPAAFDDPDSAEKRIAAALQLPDLAEGQRSQILEIAADYRPLYAELTYRMLDFYQQLADAPAGMVIRAERGGRGGPPDGWSNRMERMAELEMLRFDRTELNERTMRQLRAVLSPDQVLHLP